MPACMQALKVNQPLTVLGDSTTINARERMLPPADIDPSIPSCILFHIWSRSAWKERVSINPTEKKLCLKIMYGVKSVWNTCNPSTEICCKHKVNGLEIEKSRPLGKYTVPTA